MTSTDADHRRELARRGQCPTCDEEYQRLAPHWQGTCSPPALSRSQRALVAGLLLGNGFVGGSGPNKHFQVSTRWRPFAHWMYEELDWLALKLVRRDWVGEKHPPPAQRYTVRTHAHPGLTQFREWYVDGKHRHPAPDELPDDRLTPQMGRVWHATAGSLAWSNPKYATTRQATFGARDNARAARIIHLLESVGLEPTRVEKRVQLSPKQTTGWLEWVGPPVDGVEYKWAATREEYLDAKHDAEALRARLWHHPEGEERVGALLAGVDTDHNP